MNHRRRSITDDFLFVPVRIQLPADGAKLTLATPTRFTSFLGRETINAMSEL